MNVTTTMEVDFAEAVEYFQAKHGSSPLRIGFQVPSKMNIALGNMNLDAQIEFMHEFLRLWHKVGHLSEYHLLPWRDGFHHSSTRKDIEALAKVLERDDIGAVWVNKRKAPQPGARLMFTLRDRRFDAWYGVPDLTERIPEHMQGILFTVEGEKKHLDSFRQAIGVTEGRYTSVKVSGAPMLWIRID